MIGASESTAADAHELLGVPCERLAVISSGVSTEIFRPDGHRTPDLDEGFGFPVLASLALRVVGHLRWASLPDVGGDLASIQPTDQYRGGDAAAPDDDGLHSRMREEGHKWASRFF